MRMQIKDVIPTLREMSEDVTKPSTGGVPEYTSLENLFSEASR